MNFTYKKLSIERRLETRSLPAYSGYHTFGDPTRGDEREFRFLFHIYHSTGDQFSPAFMRLIIWSRVLELRSIFPSIRPASTAYLTRSSRSSWDKRLRFFICSSFVRRTALDGTKQLGKLCVSSPQFPSNISPSGCVSLKINLSGLPHWKQVHPLLSSLSRASLSVAFSMSPIFITIRA